MNDDVRNNPGKDSKIKNVINEIIYYFEDEKKDAFDSKHEHWCR